MKLMFFEFVGTYEAGQVYEVEEKLAQELIKGREIWDGEKLVLKYKALPVEKYESLKKEAQKIENLTQVEAKELGVKNVVETPKEEEKKEEPKGKKGKE